MAIENLNIGLFDKTMEDVLAPAEQKQSPIDWEQGAWGIADLSNVEPEPLEGTYFSSAWALPISCQTAGCAAGHIAYRTGYQPVLTNPSAVDLNKKVAFSYVTKDGKFLNVADAALSELGVENEDLYESVECYGVEHHAFDYENDTYFDKCDCHGTHLFDEDNSETDMRRIADDIRSRYYATQAL